MKVPFIDLKIQHEKIGKELKSAVGGVIDSQHFILSDCVHKLEAEIAQKSGAKYAIGLASGSDALLLSLEAVGIGEGDEVITTPFTFFATAGAVSRLGAKPVFVDIDPETFNLDVNKIKDKITSKTKAIIPVHLFGLCCDMEPLLKLAKEKSLFVIEDAAQAYGSEYQGRQAGSMGDAGCFSFYPTKNLGGAGDGGMLVTSSDAVAEKVKVLRDHGSRKKYYHDVVGMNSRLDEIQAAILLVKMKYIDGWNALRQKHAEEYNEGLKGLPLKTPFVPKGYKHIYHLYSILTQKRDALMEFLLKNGVGAAVYYPLPLHLQACYKELGYRKGDFPVCERTAEQVLSLPMFPELTGEEKKYVISNIKDFFGRQA